MNQYTKLIIEGKEIDLFNAEELPLNITRRINNIEGSIQGDYSRASVVVPATKNNILILGRSRQYLSFRIEVDGSPSFFGTAQIKNGKLFSNKYGAIEETYEINLISNNSSWFVLLGNTLLSELTTLTAPFTIIEVAGGFSNNAYIRGYAFTLIKWKEWANSVGAVPNIRYQPSYYEATPLLYIKQLVISAFNSKGYTVVSDFFDTDLFIKLVLATPFPEKMSKGYNDEYLNTKVSFSAPFVLTGADPLYNPFDNIEVAAPQNPTAFDNATTFVYTAPLTGYYEVNLSLTFNATPPVGPYFYLTRLYLNGAVVNPLTGFAFSDSGAPAAPYPTNGGPLTASAVVFANAGDVIGYTLNGTAGITIDSGFCTFTGEAIVEPDFPIDFKYLLKDWKFIDMFEGLIKMFNLSIETDDSTKTIYIEPKDAYIETSRFPTPIQSRAEGFYRDDTQKDYSQLIDTSKEMKFEFPIVEGIINRIWASDNDETIDYIELANDFKVYESRYPFASGASSGTKTEQVPFFAKTIHVFDTLSKYPDTNRTPQFPLIYPQNYILDPTATTSDMDVLPRIFYHAGQRGISYREKDGTIELLEVQGQPTSVPMTFMVNYNDDTGLDPNLGFDNQIINGIESVGLMQKFYLQDLARKDIGEVRKSYVRFNSIDNNNFTFRIKGLIDNQRYVLQELNGYSPLTDSPTSFKFYLDVYPTQDNVDNIQNSNLIGVVSLLSA